MSRRTLFPALLTLLLVAGIGVAGSQAQQRPISLADYRAELAAALDGLQRDDSPPLPSAPVLLPSGDTMTPAPLFSPETDKSAAQARLATSIEQIDLSANDNTAVRLAALERVIDRLDISQASLWDRFLRWLWDWLDRLLPQTSPIAGGALGGAAITLVGWVAIAGATLLLVLLLGYWLRRLLAGVLTGQNSDNPLGGPDGLPASASQARQQASQLADDGNYREAVRRLYLAALLRLRELGLIRFDTSLTNREVLARMNPSAPARAHLEPVVETFDRVWYGEQEPDKTAFDTYSREIDALLSQTELAGNREVRRG